MLQPYIEVVAGREIHGPDTVEPREVLRIIDGHDQHAGPPLHRRAGVLLPHVGGDTLFQVVRNRLRTVVAEELRAVKRSERFPQLILGHVVVFDEHFFDRGVVHPCVADRGLDVLLGNDSLVHQLAEFRWFALPRCAVLVVERDPQNPGDLLGRVFVLRREQRSVPAVDELQNAEEIFLEDDGDGQNRFRAETGLLVPALVEAEVGVELGQLRGVVGILDVDGLAGQRREAADRRERLGNADFLRHIADFLQRIELLVLRVDGVDG